MVSTPTRPDRLGWRAPLLDAASLLESVPRGHLDLNVLMAVNRLVVPTTNSLRGRLREGPAVIRLGGIACWHAPDAHAARILTTSSLEWLSGTLIEGGASISPVTWAAEAFFLLTDAHPFMDGNGRVARAVATWLLLRAGYGLGADPGAYMRERKHCCYHALAVRQGVGRICNPVPWTAFFEDLAAECYLAPA